MAIKDYQGLTDFIKTTKFTCGYELVVLFAAIKLKNAEGGFEKEKLADFFLEFYRIGKSNLTLGKACKPLQSEDSREIMLLLNSGPIAHLLKVGILKTFERFNPDLFKIVFDKAEEVLDTVKDQIIKFYSESPDNSKKIMDDILSKWENGINDYIKTDALKKMASSIEKINLEFMLKYLYQSYSLASFNKFLKSFQINEQDFKKFFTGRLEDASKFFIAIPAGEEEPGILKDEPQMAKPPASRIQDLTSFFQKMISEDEKELAKGKEQAKDKLKKKPKT
jgi:hypothetical protein